MGQWSNIRTIDEPMPSWVTPTHAGVIRRAARDIRGRCEALTFIDTHRKALCFGYDRGRGPEIVFDVPMYRDRNALTPMTFCPIIDQTSVDDVVHAIRLARVPAETKAQWAAEKKAAAEAATRAASMVKNEAATREAVKLTDHQYQKHSMGKHYRKTVVMS